MIADVCKSIMVGVAASAPLGPVAMLVMQKTLNDGRFEGLVSALGATLVDTLYAVGALLAYAAISTFIDSHMGALIMVGGIIIVAVGLSMVIRDPMRRGRFSGKTGTFFKTAGCALANPGAFALMFALIAFFDIRCANCLAICGVALGSVIWWAVFSKVVDVMRSRIELTRMICINRITGILVVIFGIILICRTIVF